MLTDALAASAAELVRAGTALDVRDMKPLRTTLTVDGSPKKCRKQGRRWFGVLIHTTGGGIAKLARLKGRTIEAVTRSVYGNVGMSFAHRVVMPEGWILRCADDSIIAPHCGVKAWQRAALLDGTWRAHVSDEGERLWGERWPGVKSPQHLFPTSGGNDAYLGIETVQVEAIDRATGTRFTMAQYVATARQVVAWERAHGFVAAGNRLLTHEDVQPFERWDAHGGWDPGVIRAKPTYNWPLLLECIAAAREVAP